MQSRSGFTMIESMIASTVLATVVIGISTALMSSHQQTTAMREQSMLLQLTRSLIEEIASTPFTDAADGFGGGWTALNRDRRTYDDIYDWHGYADASPFQSMTVSGAPLDYPANYRRSVIVEPLLATLAPAPTLAGSELAQVTVTATSPAGRQYQLRRLVSRVKMEG
ncbi:MAG TPA: prepilin-type N-terminal cleavage/methylation domain-containing protein [Tepidisphaeraceae bacterium]|nr:prepilin-type N-terminal cleavage/methylation domain-containing protein [Tepidisphaeraceae bacterium]